MTVTRAEIRTRGSLRQCRSLTRTYSRSAGDKGSALATGGMVTKLHAAQIATAAGCEMVIANGEKPEVLYDIVDGRRAGTRFLIPHS